MKKQKANIAKRRQAKSMSRLRKIKASNMPVRDKDSYLAYRKMGNAKQAFKKAVKTAIPKDLEPKEIRNIILEEASHIKPMVAMFELLYYAVGKELLTESEIKRVKENKPEIDKACADCLESIGLANELVDRVISDEYDAKNDETFIAASYELGELLDMTVVIQTDGARVLDCYEVLEPIIQANANKLINIAESIAVEGRNSEDNVNGIELFFTIALNRLAKLKALSKTPRGGDTPLASIDDSPYINQTEEISNE